MDDHKLYSLIYILITWFITYVYARRIGRMSNHVLLCRNHYNNVVVLFMTFLILFMGLRSVGVGADTGNYANKYIKMMNGLYETGTSVKDWLFTSFQYSCAQMMPVELFFLLVAFLYVYLVYFACKRFIMNNSTFMMLFVMGAFSFFSYGVNGIRNGLAASITVLAISYISGNIKDKLWCAFLCFVAINFHGSIILPVLSMIFAYLIRWPKLMFYVWGLAVLASLTIGESLSNIFAMLGLNERLTHYMTLEDTVETEEAISKAGFRWDFLLYSLVPIILGWYCIFKKRLWDLTYHLLLGTYIFANAIWVILIRIPYSNRIAYLSWFLYALVLAYPLLKYNLWHNQGRRVELIMVVHVSFTFFMWFYSTL